MNADLFTCPHVLDLTDEVHNYLHQQNCPVPQGVALTVVVGTLKALWEFTNKRAPAGDIGRHRDQAIARAAHWEYDAAWLIARLVEFGFLEVHQKHRLIVPDWPQQADKSCHQYVADQGITFADGTPSRRKPRRNSPADLREHARDLAEDGNLEQMAYEVPEDRRDSRRASTISPGSFAANGKSEPEAKVHDYRPTNPPSDSRKLPPITKEELHERGILDVDGEHLMLNPVRLDNGAAALATSSGW